MRVGVVLQIGYMGVPFLGGNMTAHPQYLVVRNERGQKMLDSVKHRLEITPTVSTGDRKPLVMQVKTTLYFLIQTVCIDV